MLEGLQLVFGCRNCGPSVLATTNIDIGPRRERATRVATSASIISPHHPTHCECGAPIDPRWSITNVVLPEDVLTFNPVRGVVSLSLLQDRILVLHDGRVMIPPHTIGLRRMTRLYSGPISAHHIQASRTVRSLWLTEDMGTVLLTLHGRWWRVTLNNGHIQLAPATLLLGSRLIPLFC